MQQCTGVMNVGHDEDDRTYDRRLLLMGKTGAGKSRTGNIIFNKPVFHSELNSSSVTRECQSHTDAVNNRRVTVIDTPDFIYSTIRHEDFSSELKRALDLCTLGAHAVLLLLSLNTFTEQEMNYVTRFIHMFGEEVLRYTIVLFINADKPLTRPLKVLIRKNNTLSNFINRCGQRYLEFNINALSNTDQQVSKLMQKIDRMVVDNANTCYTLEMLLENERRAEKKTREISEEHQKNLERAREETHEQMKRKLEELQQAIENAHLIKKVEQERIEENNQRARENTQIITKLRLMFTQNWCPVTCGGLFILLLSGGCYYYYYKYSF